MLFVFGAIAVVHLQLASTRAPGLLYGSLPGLCALEKLSRLRLGHCREKLRDVIRNEWGKGVITANSSYLLCYPEGFDKVPVFTETSLKDSCLVEAFSKILWTFSFC